MDASNTEFADVKPSRTFGEETRLTLRLAGPIAAAQIGQVLMGAVDTATVGRAGEAQLAAVGVGNGLAAITALFGLGLALGLDPVASQRVGAGDYRGAWRGLIDALRLSMLTAPVLVLLNALLVAIVVQPNLGPSFFPKWFPMDAGVARGAMEFAWARLPGALSFTLYSAYRAWFYACHSTRPMIISILIANVLNAALDYIFVYGDPGLVKIGLPAFGLAPMGALGAGIVTSSVSLLTIAIIAPMSMATRRRQMLTETPGPPFEERARTGVLRIARYGLPTATTILLEAGIFYLIGWRMASFGATAVAAQQVALNIASMTFMVAMSVGVAATVRVGHAVGAGDVPGTRRAGFVAFGISFGWMALCAFALAAIPESIAGIFTSDPAVIAAAIPLLRIAGLFQIFDGIQTTACGALRGAGDARLPLLINLVGYWVIGWPIGEWLAVRGGVGPPGLWYGLTAGLALVAGALSWRFHRLTRRGVARVA